jgi:hypothetical protein
MTCKGLPNFVATGEHGESEAALRHVRRHFITVDNLRAAVTKLVNATFAARDTAWWGRGNACASDSKKLDRLAAEYYPGNERPAPWDAKPRLYPDPDTGERTEFFTVGHLAAAMNRKPITIRQWERSGVIPRSVYQVPGANEHGRRRLYTRAQIAGMITIADEEGILRNDRREIDKTNFIERITNLWDQLAGDDDGHA